MGCVKKTRVGLGVSCRFFFTEDTVFKCLVLH